MAITAFLLVLGFSVTFVVAFFAKDLNFGFFGMPFYFWVASQGALLVYLLIACLNTYWMNRLDDTPAPPAPPIAHTPSGF